VSILGQLLVGWLLADLLSGIFHWWQDQFGKESSPVIGPWLITPNRLHHDQPLAFLQNNFTQRTRASIMAAGLFGALWWSIAGPSVVLFTTVIGLSLATEVHRLTHAPKLAGPILSVLQEIGVIQSPKGHALHHRPPQNRNFCALTDWLNPIFEALDIWSRAERVLRK
jgi:sterol desaturase/sphingolipid hydroxylase (fatty acid hydroxylase superfamily)